MWNLLNVEVKRMLLSDVCSLFPNEPLLKAHDYPCDAVEETDGIRILKTMLKDLLLRYTVDTQFLLDAV